MILLPFGSNSTLVGWEQKKTGLWYAHNNTIMCHTGLNRGIAGWYSVFGRFRIIYRSLEHFEEFYHGIVRCMLCAQCILCLKLLTQGHCAAAEDQQAVQELSARHIAAKQVLDVSEGSESRSWMHHFKDLEEYPERYQRVLPPHTNETNTSRFQDLRRDEHSKQWSDAVFLRGEEHICTGSFDQKELAVRAHNTAAADAQGTVQNVDVSSSIGRLQNDAIWGFPAFSGCGNGMTPSNCSSCCCSSFSLEDLLVDSQASLPPSVCFFLHDPFFWSNI
jgi:hypothetical protein